jgi:hypothetical protein
VPWEKSPGSFSLFFLSDLFVYFAKKQKVKHQTEWNPAIYWIPNQWKACLFPTGLNPVPVSGCLEKS